MTRDVAEGPSIAPLSDLVPDLVRKAARRDEPDRYLSALLAPAAAQPALLALAAFAGEMARIPASVREPMMGEIRLQWWRDAVAAAALGGNSGHPVADALGAAMQEHGLNAQNFLRMIDARAFDLSGDLHASETELAKYLADTEGAAFSLAAEVLTGRPLPDGLATNAGIAYGLARTLGRLPAMLHNGGFPLPEDVLNRVGVTRSQLTERPFAAAAVTGARSAVKAMQAKARASLTEVRSATNELRSGDDLALLPLAMVEPYFAVQNRVGFNPLEHMAEVLPLMRIWTLARARLNARLKARLKAKLRRRI